MNRSMDLTEALINLEFNGKLNGLEDLYRKMEDLIFYLQAQGQVKAAEHLLACQWELKTRMHYDKEEQWLWTFVWMKDKVLRKLGVEAPVEAPVDASTLLRQVQEVALSTEAEKEIQVTEVHEFSAFNYRPTTLNPALIVQIRDGSNRLGIAYK